MKSLVQRTLQKLLGFNNYLFIFSVFKIYTLKSDKAEKAFFYFIKQAESKEGILLDIGANIGITAVLLSKKFPDRQIIAFEPVPENIKALKRVLRFFKATNVTVLEIALGNEPGELEMILPVVDNVKKQGLSHIKHESITEFNEGHIFKVPVKTLDSLPELNQASQIAAIKIDVENFEYFVFEGGKELLQRHKPIVFCELWDNENRYKCFNFLQSLGYTAYTLEGGKMVPLPENQQTENQQFLFI